MNNAIIRALAALCLGAVLSPVSLMAQDSIQFKVPFDFTVGSKSFSAGTYTVRPDPARPVLAIRSGDGRSGMFVLTTGLHTNKTLPKCKLIFNRYGDSYFLSEVWTLHSGRQ